MRQINIFKQSQDGQRPIRFRHVPFSWFPVVRPRSDSCVDALQPHSNYSPQEPQGQAGARPPNWPDAPQLSSAALQDETSTPTLSICIRCLLVVWVDIVSP